MGGSARYLALRYRGQALLMDSILSYIGVEGGALAKITELIRPPRYARRLGFSLAQGRRQQQGPPQPPEVGVTPEMPSERSPRKKR